jgi:GNAT superfamily N-acetyltransferase
LTFGTEAYSDAIEEMRLMYAAHWAEVGIGNLAPDYARYLDLEAAGLLHVVTARDAGALVGYHVLVVTRSLHDRAELCAITDIVYLKPAYRQGFTGFQFLKYACESLKAVGVTRVSTMSRKRRFFGKVLERLGFDELEVIYMKGL